jgi:HEPN domain-containing protein
VEYAEEDLIMAKSALRHRKPLTTPSCFHSQQCAEKYLKAILVSQDIEFPKTHDLLTDVTHRPEGLDAEQARFAGTFGTFCVR